MKEATELEVKQEPRIENGVVILPEDFGKQDLKRWMKEKKIPLFKRKMRRLGGSEGRSIREGITNIVKAKTLKARIKSGELTLLRRYPKEDPPLRRG